MKLFSQASKEAKGLAINIHFYKKGQKGKIVNCLTKKVVLTLSGYKWLNMAEIQRPHNNSLSLPTWQ